MFTVARRPQIRTQSLDGAHDDERLAGPATEHAFFLGEPLEIDLALIPAAGFGPLGHGARDVAFRLAAPRQCRADERDLIALVSHPAAPVHNALVRNADAAGLCRARQAPTQALIGEPRATDAAVAPRLTQPLIALAANQEEGAN